MEVQAKQIELDGLNFSYRETGASSAPPLVLLHALGLNAQSWDEVVLEFGDKYRVLALDQRGFGGSARPGTYSFELMCDDLLHFVDGLGLEKFSLLGHSMGGTVSYLFAEAWPSRLDRLVVVDTPPPYSDKPIEIPPEPTEPLPFDWLVVPAIFRQLNEPNPAWWDRLHLVSAQTLIIGGGSTSHIPQEKLREVAELIPNCELITIEGAGHGVHLANLPAFLSAVRRLL